MRFKDLLKSFAEFLVEFFRYIMIYTYVCTCTYIICSINIYNIYIIRIRKYRSQIPLFVRSLQSVIILAPTVPAWEWNIFVHFLVKARHRNALPHVAETYGNKADGHLQLSTHCTFFAGAKPFFFLKCSENKKLLYLQNRNFLQTSQHLIFLHPKKHHEFATNRTSPRPEYVPPLKDLNRFQVAAPDNNQEAELDGFRRRFGARAWLKTRWNPYQL